MGREKAFLVWEITFYGENFPKAFRDHNRVTWHYILSFWSTSFASFIGFLVALYGIFSAPIEVSLVAVLIIEVIAVVTFYLKGKSTQNSLYNQEKAVVYQYEDLFLETFRKIKDMHLE